MKREKYLEAVQAYRDHGSYAKAAAALGIDPRTVKARVAHFYHHPEFAEMVRTADSAGIDPNNVTHYWVKTKNEDGNDFSMFVKNDLGMSFDEMREYLVEELKNHAPIYKEFVRPEITNARLLVIDPADLHIGKSAVSAETGHPDYNIEIAVKRAKRAIWELVAQSESFGIGHIVFVIGNDILHTDNARRTTTSGTPQDTDGMWWQAFLAAKKFYVDTIEWLATIANVTVVYCPSNHDYVSGFMLADTVYSWFSQHPNVDFGKDNELISVNHRKYITFGKNLIGFAHGNGAKEKDLPAIMQYEARQAWGRAHFAYWYVHHYHHKIRKSAGANSQMIEKDHIGVTTINNANQGESTDNTNIEYVRSPSAPDGWHSRNGYVNRQAVEAFIHDEELGQICRLTQPYT